MEWVCRKPETRFPLEILVDGVRPPRNIGMS